MVDELAGLVVPRGSGGHRSLALDVGLCAKGVRAVWGARNAGFYRLFAEICCAMRLAVGAGLMELAT